MYASEGAANWFSSKTKLGHCLFQGCINLAEFTFFFHKYGRRVGMMPRSSLKEGKSSLVVFPLHWVRHVKRKLMAINGPEFSKERNGSAGLWSEKVSWKASNGLSFPSIGDQRPHHSVAKHGHIAGQLSCDAPVCSHVDQE